MELSSQDFAKFACAYRASLMVENGMKLGLGTGSTAAWLVKCLAHRVKRDGLRFDAAATSIATTELAESLGMKIQGLDQMGQLDLTIDGADEFDPDLNLIKGAGGALLVEKIVATASDRMVVISDRSKQVPQLGAFPLSVEVIQYGHETTKRLIGDALQNRAASLSGTDAILRMAGDVPLITDEGHYIYDQHLGRIDDPRDISDVMLNIAGVVETGLFLDIAEAVVVGDSDGTTEVIGKGADAAPLDPTEVHATLAEMGA